jgi:hypothetical protein
MSSRRDNPRNTSASSKQIERENRREEKKNREKKTYLKKDENAGAFNNQLRAFNLQLRDIIGDGNCLFRSCELFMKFCFKNNLLLNSC